MSKKIIRRIKSKAKKAERRIKRLAVKSGVSQKRVNRVATKAKKASRKYIKQAAVKFIGHANHAVRNM